MCVYVSGCNITSLIPRPFEGEEKGPGTDYLHMLRYPKNLRGLVFCLVYLPFDLRTLSLCDPEVIGMDYSYFERDFEVARKMSCGSTKDFQLRGSTFSARTSRRSHCIL